MMSPPIDLPTGPLLRIWHATKGREVAPYKDATGKIQAYVRSSMRDKGPQIIPAARIYVGLQRSLIDERSFSLLQEGDFAIALTENAIGELEAIFLPIMQAAADTAQPGESIKDGIRRALDNVRNNPRRTTSHEEFVFATKRAQIGIEVVAAEDFLYTGQLLAQAKLEAGQFEHSFSCCKQLLELFYAKELAWRYEEELLTLLDTLREYLVQKALFEKALAYLELGIDLTEKNCSLEKQLVWLGKVGDTQLKWMRYSQSLPNVSSLETFQKCKVALSYFCSAYYLAQNEPELHAFSRQTFQELLRVEGLYLEMKTQEEVVSHDGHKIQQPFAKLLKLYTEEKRSPVYWNKLSTEQKKALLVEMEFIADYLGVRGCFESAYRFYLVLCELALGLGENIESIEAKKDDMYNERVAPILLEKAQEGRNTLTLIRKEAKNFIGQGQLTASDQKEISLRYEQFVQVLLQECRMFLDPLEEYPIAFMSCGSLHRKEMAPFSDIEGGFLFTTSSHQPFITTFCELFHLKMMALGETQEFVIGRKKSILPQGFSLESKYPPLELSGMPKQLAAKQTQVVDDPVPFNLLRSTSYLFGKKELYEEYVFFLCEVLNEHEGVLRRKHGVARVKESVEIGLHLLEEGIQESIHVKEDLLRAPLFAFEGLCIYYGILSVGNIFERLEALTEKGYLPQVLQEKFQGYFEFVFYLRYKAHLQAEKEEDTLLLTEKEREKVQSFFQTLLFPLIQTAKRWLSDRAAFMQSELFARSFFSKGQELLAKKRMIEALECLQTAACLQAEERNYQAALGNLHFFLKDFAEASSAWQKVLSIAETTPAGSRGSNYTREKWELTHLTQLVKEQVEIQVALQKVLEQIGRQELLTTFFDLEEELFLNQVLDKPLATEHVVPFHKLLKEILSLEEGVAHFVQLYLSLPEASCREIKRQLIFYVPDKISALAGVLSKRGYLFSPFIQQEQWTKQLLHWIHPNIRPSASGKESLLSIEGIQIKRGILTQAAISSLYQGKEIKKAVHWSNQEVGVIEENQVVKGYFKKHPESPGDEYAVFLLNHLLTGQGSPPVELFEVQASEGNYFFSATPAVEGEPLHHFLSSELEKERLAYLDPKQFSQMALMAFLTYPEDGKPDNYLVKPQGDKLALIGVDNDHVFTRPFSAKITGKATSEQLLVKTILFCFDQMKEPLHEEVAKAFLQIDPLAVLEEWLKELCLYNKKIKGLFSNETLNEQWKNGRLLPFFHSSDQLEMLYEKMLYVQSLLEKGRVTPLELLEGWDIRLGRLYQEVLQQHPNPKARFLALTKNTYKREEHRNFSTTLTSLLQIKEGNFKGPLPTIESFENKQYTPEEGLIFLKCIEKAQRYRKQIGNKVEENWPLLEMGSLILPSFQEEIVEKKNWRNATLEDFQKIFGVPYRKVSLKDFLALKDSFLEKFLVSFLNPLTQEGELCALNLEGCIGLTHGVIETVRDHAARLEIFSLKKTAITKWEGVSFPYLRILDLSYCLGLEKVQMNSDLLEELNLECCSSLENLNLRCGQLATLHIKGCAKLWRKGFTASTDTPASGRLFDQLKKIELGGNFALEESFTQKELQIISSALQTADRIEMITLILNPPANKKTAPEMLSLNLSGQPTLKRLLLESSVLESLKLSNCVQLEELILACPKLEKAEIQGCKKLKTIKGFSRLEEILPLVQSLYTHSQVALDLTHKEIPKENLTLLWDALRENTSVKSLHFSGLHIVDEGNKRGLTCEEWQALAKALLTKSSLDTLLFANMGIGNREMEIVTSMMGKIPYVRKLDLSENYAEKNQPAFTFPPSSLTKVHIRSETLEVLTLKGCRDLTDLTLECSNVKSVDIEGCVRLRGFDKVRSGRRGGDSAFNLKRISLSKKG